MFLQDVVALAEALWHEDELDVALGKYSGSQTHEDHAAAYLSEFAFPQAKWVLPFFYLGNIAQPLLSKVLPPSILTPPIQSMCSETLTAYSEVRRPLLKHQFLEVKGRFLKQLRWTIGLQNVMLRVIFFIGLFLCRLFVSTNDGYHLWRSPTRWLL